MSSLNLPSLRSSLLPFDPVHGAMLLMASLALGYIELLRKPTVCLP